MKYEIDAGKLVNLLNAEITAALDFNYNIQNHMEAIAAADDEDTLVRLGKAIAFNKRHINLHLQRAAVLLQLVDAFDEENDTLDVYALEARVAALAQRFGIK